MDKALMKSVLADLVPDQTVVVNFMPSVAHPSGDYTVVEVTRGRGKGGSLLAKLRRGDSEENVTIGTPANEQVLNLAIVDSEGKRCLFGYLSPDDVPPVYETNAGRAVELKQHFQGLLDAEERNYSVELRSGSVEELNGLFSVLSGVQKRGRGGQIVLNLINSQSGASVSVWSGRHSGVIDHFEIVE